MTDTATGGMVIGTGRHTYTPGAAFGPAHPSPAKPTAACPAATAAAGCDLTHTVPFPAAPGTHESNLGPVCRGHHNLKTHHGYQLTNPRRPTRAKTRTPEPGQEPSPESGAHTGACGWQWTFPPASPTPTNLKTTPTPRIEVGCRRRSRPITAWFVEVVLAQRSWLRMSPERAAASGAVPRRRPRFRAAAEHVAADGRLG